MGKDLESNNNHQKSTKDCLWGGQLRHVRARVAWKDCCAKLKHVGLNLIDPEMATKSSLIQWIIKAIEGGRLNVM